MIKELFLRGAVIDQTHINNPVESSDKPPVNTCHSKLTVKAQSDQEGIFPSASINLCQWSELVSLVSVIPFSFLRDLYTMEEIKKEPFK